MILLRLRPWREFKFGSDCINIGLFTKSSMTDGGFLICAMVLFMFVCLFDLILYVPCYVGTSLPGLNQY